VSVKPSRPTFCETPAWRFNTLFLTFVETEVRVYPGGVPWAVCVGKQSPYVLHGGIRQARRWPPNSGRVNNTSS